MNFDRRQLRAFLAVIDKGSLGRAAAQVNLSQPALSRLVQDMEARLGVPLFDRQATGMTPTNYAEALAPHARHLLFEMGQAVDTLDALRGLRRGVVRIGAVAAVARSFLPAALASLLTSAPELQIELLEAADDRLFEALARRSVDLVIAGALPDTAEAAVIAECEFNDAYSVICAADHPLSSDGSVTLSDALAESWIMPAKGSTPRTLFEAAVREAGETAPRVAIETSSPNAIVSFVSRTRYLGWLPRPLFAQDEAIGSLRVVPMPKLELSRRFMVYRRPQGLLPAAASRLLQELPLKGQ